MHAERDHLREVVFPHLAEDLKQRRQHLEPIDLRWGVETVSLDDEHAKELLVLKVCLTEIERSRPYLIVLVGERYGWIPPEERMKVAASEAGFAGDIEGKSVTALEIEFGALSSPDQLSRTWFYFRSPLPYEKMPEELVAQYKETDSSPIERLEALKQRITKEHPDRVRQYNLEWDSKEGGFRAKGEASLDTFGQQVLEDLRSDLPSETNGSTKQPDPTWQDEERWELETFIEDRGRGFLGREETVRELCELALSPVSENGTVGACVTGAAGLGKSSLFAHLHRTLEQEDVLLLCNAAGISQRSQQVDSLLRRWIGELAKFLEEDDPSAEITDAEELASKFASLLGRAGLEKRVVVLLDALNQFEPTVRAKHLTWWPKLWSENARVIATSIPGTASEALEKRPGIKAITLQPLTQIKTEQIVRAVCRCYHREIHTDVIQQLLNKESDGRPAAGNPLWLELAVEELNLLDADDFQRVESDYSGTPEERLHQLLLDTAESLPPTVPEIYSAMLARTEALVGKPLAQGFANLITVSRSGWRESDLEVLLPLVTGEDWNSLQFAILRRLFRAHVVRRGVGGQYDFFHVQMRQSVRRRNLQDACLVRRLHTHISDYFESVSADEPLRQTELMFHLIGTDDRLRTARFYAGELNDPEKAGATRALADHILEEENVETKVNLDWVLSLLDLEELSANQQSRLCHHFLGDLAYALENKTILATKKKFLEETRATLTRLTAQDPTNADWQHNLSVSHEFVGNVLMAQGNTNGALEAYRKSLAIRENLTAQDQTNAELQRNVSVSHTCVGDVLRLQGNTNGALEAFRNSLTIRENLTAQDPNNTYWQEDLSVSHERVGHVLRIKGNANGALEAYRKSLAIRENLTAQDPADAGRQNNLSVSHTCVGDVLIAQQNANGALEAHKESLLINERLIAQDPTNASWQNYLSISHERVGKVLMAQGNANSALEAFRKSLAVRENLTAQDPTNADWQTGLLGIKNEVGEVYRVQGETNRALTAFQESLTISERLAKLDPSNTAWLPHLSYSYSRLGLILEQQGDTKGALKAYQKSLTTIERITKLDPDNPEWQLDLSIRHGQVGGMLQEQGDTCGALKAVMQSVAVGEHLVAQNPANSDWQSNLLRSQNLVGDILLAQGNTTDALEAYRKSLAISERLAKQDPTNDGWQQDLSVSHEKVGSVLEVHGDVDGALKAYLESQTVIKRLAAQHPTNTNWQLDLAVGHKYVGKVLLAQGDPIGALENFKESHAISERLVSQDPTNTSLQCELAASHLHWGEALQLQFDTNGALKAFRKSLAICECLVEQDPTNADWQRILLGSQNLVGDALQNKGDKEAALEAYRKSLSIAECLAAKDPMNDNRQQDLSSNHGRVGLGLKDQGDMTGALQAFRKSLAICERLAAQNPANAVWQHDLAISFNDLAEFCRVNRDLDGARKWSRKCYETLNRMRELGMHLAPSVEALLARSEWRSGGSFGKYLYTIGKLIWRSVFDSGGMKK